MMEHQVKLQPNYNTIIIEYVTSIVYINIAEGFALQLPFMFQREMSVATRKESERRLNNNDG